MKRILLILIATIATMAVSASVAQAWAQVGTCRLHTYVPYLYRGQLYVSGAIDTCGGWPDQPTIQLEVCTRVWGGGHWNWKNDTCYVWPRTNAFGESGSDRGFVPVWGHIYDGWSWAYVDGIVGTYVGGTVQCC